MKETQILLLGLKGKVAAISKIDGKVIWSTRLGGGMGNSFVTLISDGELVFAYTKGYVHCLQLSDGRLLWSNGLSGYGYGFGSLAFADGSSAPNPAAIAAMITQQQQAAAHSGGASSW